MLQTNNLLSCIFSLILLVQRTPHTSFIGRYLAFPTKGRSTISISGSQTPGVDGVGGVKQILQENTTHPPPTQKA